jgi:hypothetical protein
VTQADYQKLIEQARELLSQIKRFPAHELLEHADANGTEDETRIARRMWSSQLESE